MLSITAFKRRLTPRPAWPPSVWIVGSMPALAMKPLWAAAAMRPSSVVARAIAVAACSACAAPTESPGEAGDTGAAGTGPAAIGATPCTGTARTSPSSGAGDIGEGAAGGGWYAGSGSATAGAGDGAADCRSATAERAASMSLRISSCISGVDAIGCAGEAAVACVCTCVEGRSELKGTTTTWRTTFSSPPPRWPEMSGSLTTGIMLSDPAGMNRA